MKSLTQPRRAGRRPATEDHHEACQILLLFVTRDDTIIKKGLAGRKLGDDGVVSGSGGGIVFEVASASGRTTEMHH